MNKPVYILENLSKVYSGPAEDVSILQEVNLEIFAGEYLAVVGASGSGKSTLLHILGALDNPSGGRALFNGLSLADLNEAQKASFRNQDLGFIFQFHHLLPEFNTQENVAMQAIIGGMPRAQAMDMAAQTLHLVGLGQRLDHAVTTLSGGERQRAAIARAVLNKPRVLLADEPTGNLDEKTGCQIAELLMELNTNTGATLIMVTHNLSLARQSGRILELKQGRLDKYP
ncbi:MAG: ABC transporter ATP-binding protein [Deltaproteobacteria bacterium]|jgi:lipoprotein-releasing system ATP-binding protein|nr:ABC transporter ATP-binding protein [Deltaproteobacteria bacterium]